MGMATNMARHDIAGRIDAIGWGLLFLMTGVLVLVPGVPDGTWLVGLGLLMLGVNATRLYIGPAARPVRRDPRGGRASWPGSAPWPAWRSPSSRSG